MKETGSFLRENKCSKGLYLRFLAVLFFCACTLFSTPVTAVTAPGATFPADGLPPGSPQSGAVPQANQAAGMAPAAPAQGSGPFPDVPFPVWTIIGLLLAIGAASALLITRRPKGYSPRAKRLRK